MAAHPKEKGEKKKKKKVMLSTVFNKANDSAAGWGFKMPWKKGKKIEVPAVHWL